ncbi:unnamed protein product [Blepharisma stoltei]|uniref:Dickkopf N-terminal cysteine-rich domain-containing protein n=1 Tax=Blepharisma stoltei TaxID=1481888 RepID=A0AAU9K1E3_9CILI|nr:unnamed protein product [Blepharisma stoltei]
MKFIFILRYIFNHAFKSVLNKMEFKLAALICIISLSACKYADEMHLEESSITCPSYTCQGSDQKFGDGTCIYYSSAASTYYVSSCSSTQTPYCPPSVGQNSTCTYTPSSTPTTKWPGERCSDSSPCSSYAITGCVSEVCRGSGYNSQCYANDNCNPGYYCANNRCIAQIEIGKPGCINDYQCVNNAGCDVSSSALSGICVEYFSVADYSEVKNCNGYTNLLCKSSLCGIDGEKKACISQLASQKDTPMACTSNNNCTSKIDSNYGSIMLFSTCSCGYNSKAEAYCGLFPGDSVYSRYLEYARQYVKNIAIQYCNTNRRFNVECMKDWWGIKEASTFNYYLAAVNYYVAVQNSEDCVLNVYNSLYQSIKKEYGTESFSILGAVFGAAYVSILI